MQENSALIEQCINTYPLHLLAHFCYTLYKKTHTHARARTHTHTHNRTPAHTHTHTDTAQGRQFVLKLLKSTVEAHSGLHSIYKQQLLSEAGIQTQPPADYFYRRTVHSVVYLTTHTNTCTYTCIYYLRSLKFTLKHLKRSYMFR